MFFILNLIIIVLVLLIAYWWANQGLLSAILHLVSVIAAGTIALAVWEPLTYLQLSGTKWDGYAWGVTLILVFTITLFLIRFALDKIVPGNVDLPHWANLAFGFPIGGLAGVLTMGIVVIGAGHIQSKTIFMGLAGQSRSDRTGLIERRNNLWLPVHTVTADFYSYISETSFWVPNSLHDVNPDIDQQAVSLMRDSYSNGKGAISLPPDSAEVLSEYESGPNITSVQMNFRSNAVDYNEQLTISSSQVRLIGSNGEVVHPYGWTQRGNDFKFESFGYYATSVPGQESAELTFHFRAGNMTPKYIQIRGTRFTLPRASGTGPATSVVQGPQIDPSAPDMTSAVMIVPPDRDQDIRFSINNQPTGVDMADRHIASTGGKRVKLPTDSARRNQRVQGIATPEGTRIVKVRVDHLESANIFKKSLLESIPDNAQIALVDSKGRTYSPIGFMHTPEGEPTFLLLDPTRFVKTLNSIVSLPEGSRDELKLIFRVTIGAEIRGLAFGNETVGQCSIIVPEK